MKWKMRSIKWKFIIILITVIALATVSIGWISFHQTSKSVQLDVERFSSQILKQANLNIDRYYRQYEQGFFLIGSSAEFIGWMQAEQGRTAEVVLRFRRVEEKYIRPLLTSHPEILSITLFNENGNEMHFATYPGLTRGYSITDDPLITDIPFTREMMTFIRKSEDYVNSTGEIIPVHVITLVKKLRYGQVNGFIKIDISLEPTLAILNEIQLGDSGIGYIVDKDGVIIAHPDHALNMTSLAMDMREVIADQSAGAWFRRESGEMIIFETIPYTGWRSVAVVPYEELARSVNYTRNLTVMIVVISLIVATLLGVVLSSSITNRILRLRRAMLQAQRGHLEFRTALEGDDEVTDLARSYNNLLDHLEYSIQELAESRIQEQDAMMSALQSQINSHFLYNALESINSMAVLAGHQDIRSTTLSLSNMLRYTANYQSAQVTIQEELDHLIHYLMIMEKLYEDMVTWDIHLPDAYRQAVCVKAIMQPVAENAIKHVLEKSGQAIHISVDVFKYGDNMIRVSISDNGEGLREDQLQQLSQKLSLAERSGQYKRIKRLGLANVHYRLRMYSNYDDTGVKVEPAPEGGLRVLLTFALQLESANKAEEE